MKNIFSCPYVRPDGTRNIASNSASVSDNDTFSSTYTWVRFSGAARTQLVISTVSTYLCGTHATGYYTGSIPLLIGNTIVGSACYNWTLSVCYWNNLVPVTNCSGFYVYALIAPPICLLRYCTN